MRHRTCANLWCRSDLTVLMCSRSILLATSAKAGERFPEEPADEAELAAELNVVTKNSKSQFLHE